MKIEEMIIGVIGFVILIIIGCIIHRFICKDESFDLSHQTISPYADRDYWYRDIQNQLLLEKLEQEKLRLEDLHRRMIYDNIAKTNIKNDLPQNCKNCGALLNSHECEYCGTKY